MVGVIITLYGILLFFLAALCKASKLAESKEKELLRDDIKR